MISRPRLETWMMSQEFKGKFRDAAGLASKGFTLLEMLLVVTVIGVLAGISVPIFQSTSSSYQMSSAVLSVTGAIQATRYQAIMHGYPYALAIDPSSQTYQIQNELPGTSTFTGVGSPIPWSVNKGIVLSTATTLQFSPGGTVTIASGSMTLSLSNATTTETITVSEVGNVTVCP
jgi:prepilin-type N-terminal cleavage/methylation domain-containing protein